MKPGRIIGPRSWQFAFAALLSFACWASEPQARAQKALWLERVMLLLSSARGAAESAMDANRIAFAEVEGSHVVITRPALSADEIRAATREELGAWRVAAGGKRAVRELPLADFEDLAEKSQLDRLLGTSAGLAADAKVLATMKRFQATYPTLEGLRVAVVPEWPSPVVAREIAEASEIDTLVALRPKDVDALRRAFPDKVTLVQRQPEMNGLENLRQTFELKVISDFPTDRKQLEAVHSQLKNAPQAEIDAHLKTLTRLEEDLRALPEHELLPAQKHPSTHNGSFLQELVALIKALKPNQLLTVICHNENGVLLFSDNTRALISDLAALKTDGKLAIITCRGVQFTSSEAPLLFSSTTTPTYELAAKSAKALAEVFRRAGTLHEALRSAPVATGLASVAGPVLLIEWAQRSK